MSFIRPTDLILKPGDYFVGTAHRVRTLLGSCVSVTLWHPARRIGAMSHFLLWTRLAPHTGRPFDARYGDEAMQRITAELACHGVRPADCEAKIFGGGNMFPHALVQQQPSIGERNGDSARQWLAAMGVSVVSEHLFGIGHRVIVFDLENGDVLLRQAPPSPPCLSHAPDA